MKTVTWVMEPVRSESTLAQEAEITLSLSWWVCSVYSAPSYPPPKLDSGKRGGDLSAHHHTGQEGKN